MNRKMYSVSYKLLIQLRWTALRCLLNVFLAHNIFPLAVCHINLFTSHFICTCICRWFYKLCSSIYVWIGHFLSQFYFPPFPIGHKTRWFKSNNIFESYQSGVELCSWLDAGKTHLQHSIDQSYAFMCIPHTESAYTWAAIVAAYRH